MKKILYSILFLGLPLLFTGCETTSYEDLIPQEYSKILYIKNSGQANITLFNDGANVDYSLTIVKSGRDPQANAQARVAVMSQAEIDKDSRYKGNNYVVLNKDCYTLRNMDLEFSSSETYKEIKFQMIPAEIQKQTEENTGENNIFIIPIRLSSQTDSINAEQRDIILKPLVRPLGIQFEKLSTTIDLNKSKDATIITELAVTMMSGVMNKWNFNTNLLVSNASADIEAYNNANGTDYKPLPTDAWYTPEQLVFETEINEAVGILEIKREALTKGSIYLVPLRLEQTESMGAIVADQSVHYLILQYLLDPVSDKINLTADMLSDPFKCGGGDGTTLAALVDGIVATTSYYHTQYGKPVGNPEWGQPFDIALATPVQVIQIGYTTRDGNKGGAPKDVVIYTKNNEADSWVQLTRLDSGLPDGVKVDYKSAAFTSETPFRYIRFSVMASQTTPCLGEAANQYWNLSEFRLWGM